MKVTLVVLVLTLNTMISCKGGNPEGFSFQQSMDSLASRKIDSAYNSIQQDCDSAFKYRLPLMVDSLLKTDTLR